MLHQKTAITWAILAISNIQTINASPLFDMFMSAQSNELDTNIAPTDLGPSDDLSYCSRLPFRTDRGSLAPPEGTPKAIFVAEGHITYVCQPPPEDPLGSLPRERSNPRLEISELTADLFDVGTVLKLNRGFVGPFFNQPTGSHGHPKGPKVGQIVQRFPAQLPKLVRNGHTFFSPAFEYSIGAPTNRPVGDLRMVDRNWAHYSLKPVNVNGSQKPVSAPVTDVYEVRTVGGQIVSPYCMLTQKPITLPYKAQLWVYGDRKFPGVTPDKTIPDACSTSRSLFITGAS